MSEIFFCSETDYPQFLALFPGHFPPTYAEFVAGVDKRIQGVMENHTIVKTYVGVHEFLRFCDERRKKPNYDALLACTYMIYVNVNR